MRVDGQGDLSELMVAFPNIAFLPKKNAALQKLDLFNSLCYKIRRHLLQVSGDRKG